MSSPTPAASAGASASNFLIAPLTPAASLGGGFQTPVAKRAFSAPAEVVSAEGGTPGAAAVTETREEMLQRMSREAVARRKQQREDLAAFEQGVEAEQCLNCGS